MTTTKKLDLSTLTETAQLTLAYMTQEPRAFVLVLKEKPYRRYGNLHSTETISQAIIYSRAMSQVHFHGSRRINKASLAAMPGKGLMVEIERPEGCKAYDTCGDQCKFYRLSDAGKAAGDEMVEGSYEAPSQRERSKTAVQQAEWSIKSAEKKMDEAQAAWRLAQETHAIAVAAYEALGDETVLTPEQQVLYDWCLYPASRSGDVLIEGTHNNAVLRRLAETQKNVLHTTHAMQNYGLTQTGGKRPTLMLIEDIDGLSGFKSYHRDKILRDGGRVIATANDLELALLRGLDEPMVIKEKTEEKGN